MAGGAALAVGSSSNPGSVPGPTWLSVIATRRW
jgi:hypothetical protein